MTNNNTKPLAKVARYGFVWFIEPSMVYWASVGIMAGILRTEYTQKAGTLAQNLEANKARLESDTTYVVSVINQRNALKQEIRDKGNPMFKKMAEARNLHKYNNPVGPNYDFLYKKQAQDHPDWTSAQIRAEIIQGATRTNESTNESASTLEMSGYVLLGVLLLRWVFTIYKAPKGEGALLGFRTLGSWLLGGFGALLGLRYLLESWGIGVGDWGTAKGLLATVLGSLVLVVLWDFIFDWFMRRLNQDIAEVDKIRQEVKNKV